jgi:large subunit ribosomal protein L22
MASKKKKIGEVGYKGQVSLRHIRVSPERLRLVVDLIRNKQIEPAIQTLSFSPQKGAPLVKKLLESAVSNARESGRVDIDKLWVASAQVDTDSIMKRIMARAQGRADQRLHRGSHVKLSLEERI